jgi:hypothetical protein
MRGRDGGEERRGEERRRSERVGRERERKVSSEPAPV